MSIVRNKTLVGGSVGDMSSAGGAARVWVRSDLTEADACEARRPSGEARPRCGRRRERRAHTLAAPTSHLDVSIANRCFNISFQIKTPGLLGPGGFIVTVAD